MPLDWKFSKLNTLLLLGWTYLALLFAWGLARSIWGDGAGWLFLLNVAAVYLFIPAPLVLLFGIWRRSWSICAVAIIACCWWAVLFGKLYLPRSAPHTEGVALNVMTYNLLFSNRQIDNIVEAIEDSDADLITLYELSPQVAARLGESLTEKYPYQILAPASTDGSGILSRYPVKQTDDKLAGTWIGPPFVYEVDVKGQTVTVVCAHPYASGINRPWRMAPIIEERDASIEAIKNFAVSHPGPLLVPLDMNTTPMNAAYETMTSVLVDSWQEAGSGLGHTFPGAASPGSSRPRMAGILMPMWMVRIDYVFHSHHFIATDARIGPWDGSSDHRPVLARLVLKAE